MNNPWSQINKPERDLNVRLADSTHPLSLYWGVDVNGKYLFIYEGAFDHMPNQNILPSLSGITTAIANDGNRAKLLIVLNDTTNWEIFHSLSSDLIRATNQLKDKADAPSIILRRLKRWQDLLKKERSSILSLEEIKGLIGELLFLSGPVASSFGWDNAISFWRGPEEAPQDFAIYQDSVEVKCQSGGSKPTVRISSLEQLNTQLPNGYLVVYTLAAATGEDHNHFNLSSLVLSIREKLLVASDATKERFEDLIILSGYLPHDKYLSYNFSKVRCVCYKIKERFPRILPEAVPLGVSGLLYSVQLDACHPFEEKPNWLNIIP